MRKLDGYALKYLIFSIVLLISFISMAFTNNFIFGQDSLTYHLPVARYLAEHNKLPEYVPYDLYYHKMAKPPLLYILTYPFFKLFGPSEYVAEIIPFLSIIIFLYVMYKWIKEEGISVEIFVFTAFLSFFSLDLMLWYYQGCLVLLFTTLTFYSLHKYFKYDKSNYFYLALAFAFLSAYSKTTGLIVFGAVVILSLMKKNYNFILISLVLSLPLLTHYFLTDYGKEQPVKVFQSLMRLNNPLFNIGTYFHPEYWLGFILIVPFVVLKLMKSYDLKTWIIFILLLIPSITITVDPRYLSLFSGYAIYISSKHLQYFIKSKRIRTLIFYGILIVILLNSFFNFLNPQFKKDAELHNLKKACLFLNEEYGSDKFVVGDADFGIGWWCRYNFTRFNDYFKYNKTYPVPDFILDSWWDFCNKFQMDECETKYIEYFNKTYELKLIWTDGKNRIYKLFK